MGGPGLGQLDQALAGAFRAQDRSLLLLRETGQALPPSVPCPLTPPLFSLGEAWGRILVNRK